MRLGTGPESKSFEQAVRTGTRLTNPKHLGYDVTARLTEPECWALLPQMFPSGFDDPAIVQHLKRGRFKGLSAEEIGDVLGRCVWDVFSNDHEVFTVDDALVDLGSFRGSAQFIGD